MKKLSILFLSVLALGITVTSCSKEEETAPQASIVGKWEFSTMEGTYGTETIPAGTKEDFWSDPNCETPAYWDFKKDAALQYGSYVSSNDCALGTADVTYKVNSNNTSFTVVEPNKTYPIVKLTATELKWREQGSSQGISYNIVHTMVKKN